MRFVRQCTSITSWCLETVFPDLIKILCKCETADEKGLLGREQTSISSYKYITRNILSLNLLC
jgi:hypothetical protein